MAVSETAISETCVSEMIVSECKINENSSDRHTFHENNLFNQIIDAALTCVFKSK